MEPRSSSVSAAMLLSLSLLPACDKQPHVTNGAASYSLVSDIEFFMAAMDTPTHTLTIPSGPDTWLITAPYVLVGKWPSLNLNLPEADKERLEHENIALETVMVVRISNGRAAESFWLDPYYDTSPGTFVVGAGDTLTLERGDDPRSLLITKQNP